MQFVNFAEVFQPEQPCVHYNPLAANPARPCHRTIKMSNAPSSIPGSDSCGPNYPMAIAGAIGGAAVGYIGFWLMMQFNLYALVLPGTMIGLGCGAQSRAHSWPLAVFAGMLALVVTVFVEWHFFPMRDDGSFRYFVQNLADLRPGTKLMLAAGTFAGFWFGRGR